MACYDWRMSPFSNVGTDGIHLENVSSLVPSFTCCLQPVCRPLRTSCSKLQCTSFRSAVLCGLHARSDRWTPSHCISVMAAFLGVSQARVWALEGVELLNGCTVPTCLEPERVTLVQAVELVEQAYNASGGLPVYLMGHSNGPLYILALMNTTSPEWRQQYVGECPYLTLSSMPQQGFAAQLVGRPGPSCDALQGPPTSAALTRHATSLCATRHCL